MNTSFNIGNWKETSVKISGPCVLYYSPIFQMSLSNQRQDHSDEKDSLREVKHDVYIIYRIVTFQPSEASPEVSLRNKSFTVRLVSGSVQIRLWKSHTDENCTYHHCFSKIDLF